MAKTPEPAPLPRAPGKAPNDVYTVLVAVALVVCLGTLGFVIYRTNELLGTPFPGFAG